MKDNNRISSFLLFAMLVAPLPAVAADSASGSVKLEGIAFEVVDGLAFPNRNGLAIALSDSAFDKDSMRKDGTVDIFDRMGHGGQVVTINLDAGAPTMCVDYSFHKGDTSTSGSVCESGVADAVTITQLTEARVAGKMTWSESPEQTVTVNFDLPIEAGKK